MIGCGAGARVTGSVIVTHDAIGLTQRPPKFVPVLADLAKPLKEAFADYVHLMRAANIRPRNTAMKWGPKRKQSFCNCSRPMMVLVGKMYFTRTI